MWNVWQAIISALVALTVLAGGFMLEKLFLEEWPWWLWGIIAILTASGAVWASWMQSRGQRRSKVATVDNKVDYVTVGDILDAYLQHATTGMRPAVMSSVRFDILQRFERSPGAMVGEGMYNRERLKIWLESNMGKLLIKHRNDL